MMTFIHHKGSNMIGQNPVTIRETEKTRIQYIITNISTLLKI